MKNIYSFIVALLALFLFTTTTHAQFCVIYVTPTGLSLNPGTQAAPMSLSSAIGFANTNPNLHIKLATGTYNLSTPLTLTGTGTVIEGGFNAGAGWTKTSQPGATVINRTNSNPEGAVNAQRLVAIYGNGATGFRFQDVTITTANANVNGMSTYGVHLTNCSNYSFVRCQVLPGNAGAGAGDDNVVTYNSLWDGANGGNGVNGFTGGGPQCTCNFGPDNGGTGGGGGGAGVGGANATPIGGSASAGGSGGTGGNGRPDNTSANGFPGSAGTTVPSGGGTGGNGGTGGSQDSNGNSTSNVGNGWYGTAGSPGISGNTLPSTYSGGFFVPGTGTNGTAGRGGGGGGGGGGAARDTDGCDAAGGGGSGGGGGGGGGGAGRGAFGGGSSFGVFLVNNGSGGIINQSSVLPGAAGAGGLGGRGGNGGNGGTSAIGNGCTNGDSDGNRGGIGGTGGAGGAGGNGGNGPSGNSISVFLLSGTALQTNVSTFNLSAQPIISADNVICTGLPVDFSSAVSDTWGFGSGSTPASATGSAVSSNYNSTGFKDITYGANTYLGFVNVTHLGISPLDFSSTFTENPANTFEICSGASGNFSVIGSGFSSYDWDFGGAITPNTYAGTDLSNLQFNTPGTYTITLVGNTDCCGSSAPVQKTIIVGQSTTSSFAVTACGSYTVPSGNNTYNLSGIYTDIIPNAAGCDSVMTIDLTIEENVAPTSINNLTATNYCVGSDLNLQVVGGNLASGANWEWFDGACGSTVIGTGNTLTLVPNASTTYFVRASAGTFCAASSCVSINFDMPTTSNDLGVNGDVATCLVNSNNWIHFYNANGRLLASVNSNGQNLGNVSVSTIVAGQPYIVPSCSEPANTSWNNAAYARSFVITPDNQPTNPVLVRLYTLDQEFLDYQVAALSTTNNLNDEVISLNQIDLTKHSGSSQDGNPMNNCGSGSTIYIEQSASGDLSDLLVGFSSASYLQYAVDGFSEFFPMSSSNSPLPVELEVFNVTCLDERAVVSWTTASETNASHYLLEASRDGVNWYTIHQATANGTTNQTSVYQYVDESLLLNKYYRLVQVDFDGTETYYGAISMNCESNANSMLVYPNPIEDDYTVYIQAIEDLGETEIQITDLSGRVLMTKKVVISSGTHVFHFESLGLTAGAHIIHLSGQSDTFKPFAIIKK